MTQSTELSPLRPQHIAQIAEIEKQCFPDPWSEHTLRGELDNPLSRWFVCSQGGRVLGYVATLNVLGEVHVTNVAVSPRHRRQGLARRLLSAAVEQARGARAFSMTLEVRESNQPAIALYRAFGFRPVGLRPRYYQNPEEGALLMTLPLKEELP